MDNTTRWNMYTHALHQYATRENSTRVPTGHIETTENGAINLGYWYGYVRYRYRAGLLAEKRVQELSTLNGWSWEINVPGPETDKARNEEILALRNTGLSLRKIGDKFGLSRQRIHQIEHEGAK